MPIKKIKYLFLLALTSHAVLFSPTVEANNEQTLRSRLNNIEENLYKPNEASSDSSKEISSETASETANESTNESLVSREGAQSEQADEAINEEMPLNEEEAKAFRDKQKINDFVKALGGLEAIDHYQVNYTLTDTHTAETIAQGEFIGNQSDGDLMGKIAYYFPKASPKQYDFEFISYRQFDLAYVKTFQFLDSMAFFNQPYFNRNIHKEISDLKDVYVAIESLELNRVNLLRDPFNSLLMLPDLNRLSRIAGDNLYQIDDLYMLSLERIEIPEYLFRHSNNFGFNFQYDMKVQPASENETHLAWNVVSEQRFDISEKDNSLNFKATVNSELSDLMLPQTVEGTERNNEKFARQMSLDNHLMLDKLTKVNMVYKESTQTYRISLVGIVEQIEFNLFSDETAGLETTEYRLDYTVKPLEREIPSLNEIDKITSAEADYFLEEILTP